MGLARLAHRERRAGPRLERAVPHQREHLVDLAARLGDADCFFTTLGTDPAVVPAEPETLEARFTERSDGLEISTDMKIVVRLIGIPVFRYEHRSVERWREGQEVDIHAEMSRMTMDVVAEVLFGTGVSHDDVEIVRQAMEHITDYYANSPSRNPAGPGSGSGRVIRGGSWYDVPRYLRAANRAVNYPPDDRSFSLGFRPARSL